MQHAGPKTGMTDVGEKGKEMKWQLMVSLRYLFGRRKEKFISINSLISVLGIVVGVAALIVTMAIMNGFNNEIKEKILSVNPHILIGNKSPVNGTAPLRGTLENIDGIIGTEEFIDGQALVNVKEKIIGILLRGIHPDPGKRITRIENFLTSGSMDLGENGIIVGKEFAKNFNLKINDSISIVSVQSGASKDFNIKGIFNTGRYDYDFNLVFVDFKEANKLLGDKSSVTWIGLKVREVFEVDNMKARIQTLLKPPSWVMTWKDIDKNLFSALKLEKIVMFIVVALIVCVACFNIISTLIMTVMEKTKDIGILKAIGVTRFGIMSVFLLEGIFISIIGIALGSGIGLGVCYLQSEYELVKLPPDVYYIYSVPVKVMLPDTLFIIGAAFVLGLFATLYPSLHASRLNPIDALRYE